MKTNMIVREAISTYNDIDYEIDDMFMEIATESETENVDDTANKENFAKKLMATVEKIIREIYSIIDRFIQHVQNILLRIAQTDVGFRDNCRRAMVKNKPYEAVKLIVYNYNDQYLETQANRMTTECMAVLTNLKSDYQKNDTESGVALDMNKRDIIKYILLKIGCSKDITDINLYFELLKKNFRVEKKEILFKASAGDYYYKRALEIDKIKKIVSDRQTTMKNQAGVIKAELMNITKNKTTQNDVKRRAIHIYKQAGKVYNFYTSFLKIYIQFKIEESLMYRAVLKKLWHFQ